MEDSTEILQLGGPHLKTCKCCGIQFYGRKNQKFCTPLHKAKVNNQKRSELNEEFSPWFREMTISYKALHSSLNQRDEDLWISISVVTGKGFNPDIATKRFKVEGDKIYKLLFDIAFNISKDKQFVKFDFID